MPPHIVFAALSIGAALPLLWWSVAASRAGGDGWLARFSSRGEGSTDMRELALASSAASRVVLPASRALFHRVRRLAPSGRLEALDRNLELAGLQATWPLEKLVAAKLVAAAALLVLGIVTVGGLAASKLPMLAAFTSTGFFGPNVAVARRARLRQEQIQRDLPDALDQITMGVEAGLGFEGAIQRVAEAGRGPLAAEFSRVLKEMHIGVSRTAALRSLSDRSSVEDLRTFVLAVVQAEEYGLPVAQVLRVQAAELRTKRRQRAEEEAMRLPVKLIFPLGLCIFPSLFIVILGPGAIRIWRALGL